MASEILLEINGHTYHALRFCYEFYRYTDVKGKPVTGLEGGDIHVVLESNADNSLLETMLSDKSRQVPYHSWPDFEPAPICGKIQLIRDDVEVFRELVFEEGYIYRYHESMTADGFPMSILLSISTMRLDINRNVRLDRRLLTTYGFGWAKYKDFQQKKNSVISAVTQTEVAEIEIITPLSTNNYTNSKGLEFGQSYKLKVKSYTNGMPKSTDLIQWEYSYISNNGNIIIGSFKHNNRGESIVFKVSNEDMIKSTLTFYAYICSKDKGGKYDIAVNPLYYYKGRKQWGKLQSERDDENSKFSSVGHNLSLYQLLKDKNADYWAKSRMRSLDRLTEETVLNYYKSICVLVLSNNDDIEQTVINNFITGDKSILSFDENSILSKTLHTVPSFQPYFRAYLDIIKELIEQKQLEVIDGEGIKQKFISKGFNTGTPDFSVAKEIISYDYFGIFGGTQKIILDIEAIQISLHKYQVKTKMRIKDWYGSDWQDINGRNAKPLFLQYFFWLQHHYNYHPFETEVIFVSDDIITLE